MSAIRKRAWWRQHNLRPSKDLAIAITPFPSVWCHDAAADEFSQSGFVFLSPRTVSRKKNSSPVCHRCQSKRQDNTHTQPTESSDPMLINSVSCWWFRVFAYLTDGFFFGSLNNIKFLSLVVPLIVLFHEFSVNVLLFIFLFTRKKGFAGIGGFSLLLKEWRYFIRICNCTVGGVPKQLLYNCNTNNLAALNVRWLIESQHLFTWWRTRGPKTRLVNLVLIMSKVGR